MPRGRPARLCGGVALERSGAVRVGDAGVEAEAVVIAPPPSRTALIRIALAHSILIGQRILMSCPMDS